MTSLYTDRDETCFTKLDFMTSLIALPKNSLFMDILCRQLHGQEYIPVPGQEYILHEYMLHEFKSTYCMNSDFISMNTCF